MQWRGRIWTIARCMVMVELDGLLFIVMSIRVRVGIYILNRLGEKQMILEFQSCHDGKSLLKMRSCQTKIFEIMPYKYDSFVVQSE